MPMSGNCKLPEDGRFCLLAKRCRHCSKRQGLFFGLRGFGLRQLAHEARCEERQIKYRTRLASEDRERLHAAAEESLSEASPASHVQDVKPDDDVREAVQEAESSVEADEAWPALGNGDTRHMEPIPEIDEVSAKACEDEALAELRAAIRAQWQEADTKVSAPRQ
eukprot:TRINITY_DN81802_c0_g1_i1.p1 TRINITY_DN81802_c0_g1~~TRINITY_DN81802_c0_g1_i1.p1  ORF type:complete len:165 (+),score=39.85 TRINITY_DN81802_c0_g1_i1:60-554(+)